MVKYLPLLLALWATQAHAQTRTVADIVAVDIGQCIVQRAALQAKIEELEARIKQLEAKPNAK